MKKSPDALHSNHEAITGSPSGGEPVFLAAGQLRRTHGLTGEMVMTILTDFPARLRKGKTVFVGEKYAEMHISGVRSQNKDLLVTFEGIENPDQANKLRNKVVYVKADSLPELPEGEYYHHQLIGLQIEDETGSPLGVLAEILETGANDVYVVKSSDGSELLLPAIEDVILEVDLAAGRMRAKLPIWS
ncbi:MAG: ribosome maturation factor RimM [Anaerolineaceae bacterium]